MASQPSFTALERTECRAFGTIKASELQTLQDLLIGLSGSHGLPFQRHEVVLRNDERPPVLVHLVQALGEEEQHSNGTSSETHSSNVKKPRRWTVRRETLNTRGAIKDLKVSVRLVNESPMEGADVKGFWESLGFQHERESVKRGLRYTIQTLGPLPVHVSVTRLQKLTERGDVSTSSDLSPDHRLVEAVCSLESSSHTVGAEIIGKLQELLHPLVILQKG